MLAGRLLQGMRSALAKVVPARGETRCWISGSSLGSPLLEDPNRTRGRKGKEGRKREGKVRRVEVKGRKVVILNLGTLIYMKLVNYTLWPDIFCHLEGNQKGVGS